MPINFYLTTSSQFGSLESVVDDWLGTGLDARHVVSHGVHAGLGGVDLDENQKTLESL